MENQTLEALKAARDALFNAGLDDDWTLEQIKEHEPYAKVNAAITVLERQATADAANKGGEICKMLHDLEKKNLLRGWSVIAVDDSDGGIVSRKIKALTAMDAMIKFAKEAGENGYFTSEIQIIGAYEGDVEQFHSPGNDGKATSYASDLAELGD